MFTRTFSFVGTIIVCFFVTSVVAQEAPYIPNMWDYRVLERTEKNLQELAQHGEKEKIVEIISVMRTQLGILTDAKSQYILFEVGRMAEQQLPPAIQGYAEKQGAGSGENTLLLSGGTDLPSSGTSLTGQDQTETTGDTNTKRSESGVASYYGDGFQGRHTTNGDSLDNQALTAAHKTLPFNTRVKVINTKNNLRVIVRINDRGPYTPGRVIDLTQAAFKAINNDSLRAGILQVTLELVE